MSQFSNHPSSLQLIDLLMNHEVTHVVVCPGSRNAPLVHNFAEAEFILHEVTDERSAGFFANGLVLATEKPVVVCVTSGSALLNVAPAVAEAYYQRLPLIVISADRPEAWIGQMDGQTMPQPNVFGQMVVRCVNLPEGKEPDHQWHRNRLINEALINAEVRQRPVHINVPLSEPLFQFDRETYNLERFIRYIRPAVMVEDLYQQLYGTWSLHPRRMIIIGQLAPNQLKEFFIPQRMLMLRNAGVVVLFEQLSNLQVHLGAGVQSCITNFDEILSHCVPEQQRLMVPDLLITMGGHIVSKRLKRFLRDNPPGTHWHVTDSPDQLPDLFQHVHSFIEVTPREMMMFVCAASRKSDVCTQTRVSNYLSGWMLNHEFSLDVLSRYPTQLPEQAVLEALSEHLAKTWHLHVANSSMVRNVQRFLPNLRNIVRCNRGINGIEGSLSTAVGYRAAGLPTLVLIGDLSFFYDANGLWNSSIHDEQNKAPLRILLLNNGGGGIFRQLPGLDASPYRDRYVAAQHNTTAEGVALQNDIAYRSVRHDADLADAFTWLLDTSKKQAKVALLEVFVGVTDN